jgi:hypothetical protein
MFRSTTPMHSQNCRDFTTMTMTTCRVFESQIDVDFDMFRREMISRAPTATSNCAASRSTATKVKKRFEQFDLVMETMLAEIARVERAQLSVARAAIVPAVEHARPPLDELPCQLAVPVPVPEQLPVAHVEPLQVEQIGAKNGLRTIVPLTRLSPTWVNDLAAPLCHACRKSFSFWTRRHHCRSCGVVVCGSCSSRRLPCVGGGRARVCNDCAVAVDEPMPSECIVCMSSTCDTLLLPCAHSSYCMSCASQLNACALCRGFILKRQYLFVPSC